MIHASSRIIAVLTLAGLATNAAAQDKELPQYEPGWWQQVAASIAQSEYQINNGDVAESGQARFYAVNRAQNLRAPSRPASGLPRRKNQGARRLSLEKNLRLSAGRAKLGVRRKRCF